ncbi:MULTISPECIES: BBE domain-containing protein [unclassified Actinopolyspora]|uniref:FAD-dependent oxidoreductase n=1 Tax=unclassified Actinopolyspora TaxID=2639451 RepID=UPI0013F5DF7C|nr:MULTISPECIES: BBE domain-containing protein [unclassified Actinopolyspora]NHD16056.1 FAD-binding oxidoreductase [Actinopolyspora sp. BKK2]NHE74730.1 FAD-binding oxidoreductase [Actinopolyspora sp. BKK1]
MPTANSSAPTGRPRSITPTDGRFITLTSGMNQRYQAAPEVVYLPESSEQVRVAVGESVTAGNRISVHSGGHCFEDFVFNPEVEAVVDLSAMNGVYFDSDHQAFAVEAGARLLDVYERLYLDWGVTLPGGLCYSVGAGGHVAGGGYGLLSRQHGLTVDHLYGVEVVVVDAEGRARLVTATREHTDPNRDLWWGHTGGGGGNFGIVTRYLFRSPGAVGEPPELLPQPPDEVLLNAVSLPWEELNREALTTLLGNFTGWYSEHSEPRTREAALSGMLMLNHSSNGHIGMLTQVDAGVTGAEDLLREHLERVLAGTGGTPRPMNAPVGEFAPMPELADTRRLSWLRAVRLIGTNTPYLTDPTLRGEHKSAYGRNRVPDSRASVLYDHLTAPSPNNPNSMLVVMSYGGAINTVGTSQTASAQRDSHYKLLYQAFWQHEEEDAENIAWVRSLYERTYADSGGVPVPDEFSDGCYVNYPDVDLGDERHNRSGTAWHDLYYKDNYPRLQQVKARWDPGDVFRHSQSVRLPGDTDDEH